MDLLQRLKEEDILISPDIIPHIKSIDVSSFVNYIKNYLPDITVVDLNILNSYFSFIKGGYSSNVKVVSSYDLKNEPKDITTWFKYYNKRFESISSILKKRQELSTIISISRINKFNQNKFSLIGLISNIRETSSGNYIIELEDQSGTTELLVSKSSQAYGQINDLLLDEVVGVNINQNGRWLFVESIIFPDIPIKEQKQCDDDSVAVFVSDIHIGSKDFMEKQFKNFIDWIRGEWGSETQKVLSSRVKYLFIVGDLVDGIGVYPNQEEELSIKDIYKQYEEFASYLKQVPKEIKIIISPGNHDATRIALPQPPLQNKFSKALDLPNVIHVSNPSLVNIHSNKMFSGYDILVYHGNSFDYYLNNVPKLREAGYQNPEVVMEFLLKKRHLSPTHGATRVAPSIENDFLLISKVPDVFVSGHVHQSGITVYKGVTIFNTSCFQAQSAYMNAMGMVPNPAKVPVMSLRNKKVHIIDFN